MPGELYKLKTAVDSAMDGLNIYERKNILHGLPIGYISTTVVNKIIEENLDLYRELLSDERLKDFHLAPLAGYPEGTWIEKAELALEFGYSPVDIANSVYQPFWSWSGKESAMWAVWSDKFNQLQAHENPDMQAIGELGLARADGSKATALAREHEEAVYGFRGDNLG